MNTYEKGRLAMQPLFRKSVLETTLLGTEVDTADIKEKCNSVFIL